MLSRVFFFILLASNVPLAAVRLVAFRVGFQAHGRQAIVVGVFIYFIISTMKFIITGIEFCSEGQGKFSITPDHWIFRLEQIEKPRFVNSTTEIVLLNSDERVPIWKQAFHEKAELYFTITL